jgi:hypothetical protein
MMEYVPVIGRNLKAALREKEIIEEGCCERDR